MAAHDWSIAEMTRLLVALPLLLALCGLAQAQQAEYESFEDGVPAHFIALRPDSLSVSPWHSKQGARSLRWDFRQGETLLIRHGIGDPGRTGGFRCQASFSVWLYLEQPVDGALTFEFREGEKLTGSFVFPLQFTGWRQGRPFYQGLAGGPPTAAVDSIRVTAPAQATGGTVFVDFLKYNTLTYPGRGIDPQWEARWRRPVPDEGRFPRPVQVTEAERAGIRKLLGPEEGPGLEEVRVKALCDRVQALGIVRDEHGVRGGPGIDRHYQYCGKVGEHGAKESAYWPDEGGPGFAGMETPGRLCSLAYDLAVAYRASHEAGQRERLAAGFLLIEDYLYDQGMQAGAGFHWNWWVGEAWAQAIFLMRDVLAAAGSERLARQGDYLLWNYGGDAVFSPADPPSHMDYYHLYLTPVLRACLVQVEPAEQVRWLRAFTAMLERSILQPTSALKIDGCAYHHGGHYFAYARNAFGTLPKLLLQLSDTPWRLGPEAHERFRRAMLAQRFYCNQRDLLLALSGRRPFFGYQVIDPAGLDVLARCGTPDGKRALDPEVAAAYLRFVPEAAAAQPYQGLQPEPEPNGTFAMPYAALLCHRREDWLAAVHGQSKYIWGSEREGNVNCFGIFQGLGNLEILAGGKPVTAQASGRQQPGWDWRHFEGTTAPQLPLETINKGWSGTTSPETFVGGLCLRGRQGLFAMALGQPLPGGKTLTGRKSWHFLDNRVLCLGSDLSSDEGQYPTQTTLCQKGLPKSPQGEYPATALDGAAVAGFPQELALDAAKPHWFLDVQQTGYYLPPGQRVTVARRHQQGREYADLGDSEGDFLTVWLDHGVSPAAAAYEYLLVVRATAEAMRGVLAQPPYQVLQRDRAAHVVWDTATRCWSCALFTAGELAAHAVGTEALQVKSVDRPCLLMQEGRGDGRLTVAVADPDLNLQQGVNQPQALRVTLRGAWRLTGVKGTACAWELPEAKDEVKVVSSSAAGTVLEIVCRHGASYDLTLER